MNYDETLNWLFTQTAVFSRDGASAYKPGLDTITALCRRLGDPHRRLRCVHIAGTNGKGSTASTLAAIFTSAGLKTALFTSPHLLDFRERIRVDGRMIPRQRVVDFVADYLREPLTPQPSFFELTTALAFTWFAERQVDIAVIETGLGGRLDSTNIITPLVSVITNISLDHTGLLGNTLEAIASEKAGIIKPGVPVIVGEAPQPEVRRVFERTAALQNAPITFAAPVKAIPECSGWFYPALRIHGQLGGEFQPKNTATVLEVMRLFPEVNVKAVRSGFASVCELTGLRGRLTQRCREPWREVYDTGHNPGAWQYLTRQLQDFNTLVIGFAADKDVRAIAHLLPRGPRYVFTRPSGNRGLDADVLRLIALEAGIEGRAVPSVAEALALARQITPRGGSIFIGGSNFVVADYLRSV